MTDKNTRDTVQKIEERFTEAAGTEPSADWIEGARAGITLALDLVRAMRGE